MRGTQTLVGSSPGIFPQCSRDPLARGIWHMRDPRFCPEQRDANVKLRPPRYGGYFKSLSILAQASATLLVVYSIPGKVAHPPFAMKVSCFHESVALSSAK